MKKIYDQSLILENKIISNLEKPSTEDLTYDILIIEDDLLTIKLLIDFFSRKGYSCRYITTGSEALEELQNYTPKLILLDILLDYEQPYTKDLCGTCTACIDACPTQALKEYQLNATKCISYLTVEYKSEFDIVQKNKLNGWIYGCDICQRVCPWNTKKQKYTDENSFKPMREIG